MLWKKIQFISLLVGIGIEQIPSKKFFQKKKIKVIKLKNGSKMSNLWINFCVLLM